MKKVLITMIVSVIVMMSLVSRGVAATSIVPPAIQGCPNAFPDESCNECVSSCSLNPETGVVTPVQKDTVCNSETTYRCVCTPSNEYYCASGYYGNPQTMADTCTKCPDNATCVGVAVGGCGMVGTKDFTCKSDYYKNGTGCTACPDNATCDGVNFTCNEGFRTEETKCSKCPADTYLKDDQCNPCPNNATCDGVKFTCGEGFREEETKCSKCEPGTYLENNQCKQCPPDTYRTDEMNECETCPDYSTCDDDQSGFACVTNSTITTDEKSCLCNPGYYPDNNSCIACDKGTYKSEAGNTSCTPCDVPYEDVEVTTDSEAATSKTQCKIESTEELEDDTGYYSYPNGCSYSE